MLARWPAFYERHPYPPAGGRPERLPAALGRRPAPASRFPDLFWPDAEPYRDDRSILVAGCGTTQAAHYALRWPRAQVIGIDISATSIAFTQGLKREHALDNLEVHQLAARTCGGARTKLRSRRSAAVCCIISPTPTPACAHCRDALHPAGTINMMVYAPYGRAGVYMLQETTAAGSASPRRRGEVRDLAASLKALPSDHPIAYLLHNSPDFANTAGLADALLHPRDRSYSVPELLLRFWTGAASVVRSLGAAGTLSALVRRSASAPHHARLAAMTAEARIRRHRTFPRQHGTPWSRGSQERPIGGRCGGRLQQRGMARFQAHPTARYARRSRPAAAGSSCRADQPPPTLQSISICPSTRGRSGCWRPSTENARSRRSADQREDLSFARVFFLQLWRWDQVVFDTSRR